MYQNFLDAIEKRLILLVNQKKAEAPLDASIQYLLQTGGKRIRPILLLATCKELGFSWEQALDVAAAIEYIHCYSLIHDDLPCMDNDDFRRGKPTLHKKFTEAVAVLTGDFFLTFAFEVIAAARHIDPSIRIKLIELIAKRSGAQGMIGGQMLDLYPSETPLVKIDRKKTAALFAATFEAAGLIASVSREKLFFLRKIGLCFGLCFQLADDIDDKQQDKTENNFVLTAGEEKTKRLYNLYKKRIENLLGHFPNKILKEVIMDFLQTKKSVEV